MEDAFRQRGISLEEHFFAKKNQDLLEKIRSGEKHSVTKADIRAATGISDEAVLDRLVHMKVSVETLAALSIVPLIEVAWADRTLEIKEREAVLKAAHAAGILEGSPGHRLLEGWLAERPDPKMLAAWKDYVAALAERLDAEGYAQVRENLVQRARDVAKATGGFLGIGAISPAEQRVIHQIEAAFHE